MNRDTDKSNGSGYAIAVTSTFASGLTAVIGKWNLEYISPLLMNALIFSVAGVFLTAYIFATRRAKSITGISSKGWFWIMMFSLSSVLAVWGYWAGIQRMDPSLATLLNRTEVVVAIVLGMIFLRERFTKMEAVGAILSVVGIITMRLTLRIEYSSGFWLVLGGAIFFGFTEFFSKIAVRYVTPLILGYLRNLVIAVMYLIAFAAVGHGYDRLSHVWLGVLAVGLIGPVAARLLYLNALKRLELSKVAVISQGQPVFVIIIAVLALGQLPTFREVTGGIVLTAGCLIMIASRYPQLRYFRHHESSL